VTIYKNFTGRDFASEFERLLTILKLELPEYTDFNHSDAGIALIRLLSRETDLDNKYIDRAFEEGFLETAKAKQSLIDLGKLVGFLPRLASGAATLLSITKAPQSVDIENINIPAYSRFQRRDGITYMNLQPCSVSTANPNIEIEVIQGNYISKTLSRQDFREYTWSDRLACNLGKNVIGESVSLRHGYPQKEWQRVETFIDSEPDDFHYWLELDGNTDNVLLVIGDGVMGSSYPEGETLSISYIVCDGAAGNGGANTIRYCADFDEGVLTVNNNSMISGGAYAEDTESIRRNIPRLVMTQRRGVVGKDYEAILEHAPGIRHAKSVDIRQDNSLPHLYVKLYVVPEGGGLISDYYYKLAMDRIKESGCYGTDPCRYILSDAIQRQIAVSCVIGVEAGYNAGIVKSAVEMAIRGFFHVNNHTIGGKVEFARLHSAISVIEGVSYVEFQSPTGDIELGLGGFPVISGIQVTTR